MASRTAKVNGRYPITKGSESPPSKQHITSLDVPKRDVRASLAGQGPIPRAWLATVLALVAEQLRRIGTKRPSKGLSNMEVLVMSRGLGAAEKVRNKGAARLAGIVERTARLQATVTRLQAERIRLDDKPVVGAHGELLPASKAEERMGTVAATVTKEADAGSVKHRRVALWLRHLAPVTAVLDLPVLLYFIGEVFNVDWAGLSNGTQTIGSLIVPLLTSLVFAILGTAAVAIGLHFFGRDLNGLKDKDGHLIMPKGKAGILPRVYVGLSVTVAVGAGVVMAYRIITDSLSAGNGGLGASILGVFFACIVLTLNVVIFSVHYRDGSVQTEEIDHHARQLKPIRTKQAKLDRQIDRHTAKLVPLRLKAEHIHARTLAKMGEAIKGADQVRLLARSYHQGCGTEAELLDQAGKPMQGLILPVMSVDTSVLDELMKRLHSPGHAVVSSESTTDEISNGEDTA